MLPPFHNRYKFPSALMLQPSELPTKTVETSSDPGLKSGCVSEVGIDVSSLAHFNRLNLIFLVGYLTTHFLSLGRGIELQRGTDATEAETPTPVLPWAP